jgi:hypothetical protein
VIYFCSRLPCPCILTATHHNVKNSIPCSPPDPSLNNFADAHALGPGMPVAPNAGSATGRKRYREKEDFDSAEGVPGRRGVGRSPRKEREKQIKKGKKAHLRMSGSRVHECTTCGQACATSSDLTRHLRVHSGDKPYSCDACGKAFATSGALTVHLRVHPR